MTNDERAAFILEHRMGFPPSAAGPYVTALRKQVGKQVAQGMTNRSGGSWDTENWPDIWNQHEERARVLLEWDWEIEHGHSHLVELKLIDDDAPIMWRWNFKTMRWHLELQPRFVRPWIADRIRRVASALRVIWNRKVRRLRNPYSLPR